jgi:septum formation protein
MKLNHPLILASASPRRRELLATLGVDFSVVVPEIVETPRPGEKPRAFAERLAEEKACAVEADGIIVAADTIVVLGETILGKPVDAEHARDMLTALSDQAHEVVTGVCVKSIGSPITFSVITKVFFRALSPEEIEEYVASGDPLDKAGAYAIQGGAAPMVHRIEGSYTNVVGLPLCELHETLLSL